MGEPTCLMQVNHHQEHQSQPFSYTSGLPNSDSNQVENTMPALGQSVSFGRFMTESLDWEKWSSFSQNRYVEEAERYSKPGSVAQKKAFFEAHYKNLAAKKKAEAEAAAALLEQQSKAQEQENVAVSNSEPAVDSNPDMVIQTEESGLVTVLDSVEKETEFSEAVKVEKSSSKRDQAQVTTAKKKKITLSSSLASSSKITKKSGASSSKITKKSGALSKTPLAKSPAPKATPMSKKPSLELGDKKRPTPKSLHMGVNFSPIREISRLKSTVIRKIDNSRFGSNFSSSSKPSKDCPTPLKTPNMASKTSTRQQALETPCSANRRGITTPMNMNPSVSATKRIGPKWRAIATDCSKFLSACRNKTRSPFSSTPFSFMTEERAAKRKGKLEEKFNANEEAQEEQAKTKVKDKPETETGKSKPNFCFKARPLPNFYKQRKTQEDETDKAPLTRPNSPRPCNSKATPRKVEIKSSRTPSRALAKSNNDGSKSKNLQGKSNRGAACSPLISRPKRTTTITHENTSPNIQCGIN